MHVGRTLAAALTGAVLGGTALLVSAGPAAADVADTPVGRLTAEFSQWGCMDFGADVGVMVTGGAPGATYVARSLRDDRNLRLTEFTLDSSGHGVAAVRGVYNDDFKHGDLTGTATIIVTNGDKQGTVTTFIDCPSAKGG